MENRGIGRSFGSDLGPVGGEPSSDNEVILKYSKPPKIFIIYFPHFSSQDEVPNSQPEHSDNVKDYVKMTCAERMKAAGERRQRQKQDQSQTISFINLVSDDESEEDDDQRKKRIQEVNFIFLCSIVA